MALLGLVGMQLVFWIVTQPVNRFWVEGERLGRLGARFFAVRATPDARPVEWTELRDRWERSHIARAALGLLSLTALVVAVACADCRA